MSGNILALTYAYKQTRKILYKHKVMASQCNDVVIVVVVVVVVAFEVVVVVNTYKEYP